MILAPLLFSIKGSLTLLRTLLLSILVREKAALIPKRKKLSSPISIWCTKLPKIPVLANIEAVRWNNKP